MYLLRYALFRCTYAAGGDFSLREAGIVDLFFNPVSTSIAEDCDVLRRHGLTLEEYQHNFYNMSEVEPNLKAICLEEHPDRVELQELFQI